MGPDYFEPRPTTPRPRDLAWLAAGADLPGIEWKDVPDAGIRMLDHWDNMDGTVERGYAGRSLFFEDGRFRGDDELLADYAELLGSIRINAISINNVNVRDEARWLITNDHGELDNLRRVSDIFMQHGIRVFLAVNFAAPRVVGGLPTSDPLDPEVREFWARRVTEIYQVVPDFGGFVVKADAEGEPGPLQYGRSHADGANLLADLLAPHGGLVFWRAFVYNHEQDWRDRRTDRARAAFDHFTPLAGSFADNVVLQVKNGPIDFQVMEPVSPLLGAMPGTNVAVEFQITQEYLGQQQHVCFEAPIWKEVLDFRFGDETLSERLRLASPSHSGVVAVANTGLDANWTGHALAQANLYAFGRLAWDASLSPEQIAEEWARLTYPQLSDEARDVIVWILTTSRDTYRDYTTPLGLGFFCRPGHHYGVDVDGYEYDKWGTYHFADRDGVGVDRTVATGSGYTSQYPPEIAARYDDPATCPDDLLLFFHHVPYGHVLQSGKTVVQHIYDSHFEGHERVLEYQRRWAGLEGELDEAVFSNVRDRLAEQAASSEHWRDVVNTYFLRHSGIPDANAHPDRVIHR